MGFREDIDRLAEQVRRRSEHATSEEAVKQALILPFIATLGYDIYDPREVQPEYVADFAVKRGGQLEKVDYAIRRDGVPIMFVEAKKLGQALDAFDDQLARYFNATPTVRVAVLTNGLRWRFFTDLRQPNIMDPKPFLDFDFTDYTARDVEALEPFRADDFTPEGIVEHAEGLIYIEALTAGIADNLRNPSEPFVRFLIKALDLKSTVTAKTVERFHPLVKKAIQAALVALMTRSIQQEIAPLQVAPAPSPAPSAPEVVTAAADGGEPEPLPTRSIVTTEEEIQALAFVRDLCSSRSSIGLSVEGKDATGYYGMHCGKVTWWFLRLFWDARRKSVVTRLPVDVVRALALGFEVEEAPSGQGVSRIYVQGPADLPRLTDLIVRCYEDEARQHVPATA